MFTIGRDYVPYNVEDAYAPTGPHGQFFNVHENSMKWLANDLYQVGNLVDTVAYAAVYEGVNVTTGEAINVQISNGTDESNRDLENEKRILKNIVDAGFPTCMWFGSYKHQKVLVTEKFGSSLAKLLVDCKGSFTLKTTLMLADQCVARLQTLHQNGFIHCNINPDNIVMGVGELRCNQVFLTGFGLAKDWRIQRNEGQMQSDDAHEGLELGPHDDLINLGCMLFHVIKGQLPLLSKLEVGTGVQDFAKLVNLMKEQMVREVFQDFPEWLIEYMTYLNDLKNLREFPDYCHLRRIFQEEMNRNCFIYDCQFDWILHKYVDLANVPLADQEDGYGVPQYYNEMSVDTVQTQ